MRFMSIYRTKETNEPPCQDEQGRMGALTDGPFVETKEVIGGFAILECQSKAEAIEMAKVFLNVVGGDGESEVRQMAEF